jgi:hypothetical protein
VQTLVTTSGETYTLSGEFTIDRITTASGNTTQSVQTINYSYVTTNTTDLANRIELLKERNERIEELQAQYGTGIGGGLGDTNTVVIVAVAALALILIGRSSNG